MQKQINVLLGKEMSRKEFLVTLGFGLASVVGLGSLLGMLGHKNPLKPGSNGYGSTPYGG